MTDMLYNRVWCLSKSLRRVRLLGEGGETSFHDADLAIDAALWKAVDDGDLGACFVMPMPSKFVVEEAGVLTLVDAWLRLCCI